MECRVEKQQHPFDRIADQVQQLKWWVRDFEDSIQSAVSIAGETSHLRPVSQGNAVLEAQLQELRQQLTQAEKLRAEAQQEAQALRQRLNLVDSDQERCRLVKRMVEAEKKAGILELKLQRALKEQTRLESEAGEREREIQKLAYQDNLTGLANRHLILEHVERSLGRSGAAVLLLVDLDRFKVINDALGFKGGDELLIRVSERIQRLVGGGGAVGRRGEDEFLVFLFDPSSTKPEQAVSLAEVAARKLKEELAHPFTVQGQKLFVQASIGISVRPGDAETAAELLEHADTALAEAKRRGRNCFEVYSPSLKKARRRSFDLELHMRHALAAGEMFLEYQPVVHMTTKRGKLHGTLVGAEALIRWNHRQEGLLMPAAFLPAAEESGQIVEIGHWTVMETCRQLREWHDLGLEIFATINLSSRQLLQADLAENVWNAAHQSGVAPASITFDIQEDFSHQNAALIDDSAQRLRSAGFRVAIDNYGIGFSSLVRLAQSDILKIGAPLIRASCDRESRLSRVCVAAVQTATNLALVPIAEGVETVEQAQRVLELGCSVAQGYLFSSPVKAARLVELHQSGWSFP